MQVEWSVADGVYYVNFTAPAYAARVLTFLTVDGVHVTGDTIITTRATPPALSARVQGVRLTLPPLRLTLRAASQRGEGRPLTCSQLHRWSHIYAPACCRDAPAG